MSKAKSLQAAPRSSATRGITVRGIEVLAKSIYRELCDRGCRRSDVIRLATALLDQLVTHRLEHRVVNANRAE